MGIDHNEFLGFAPVLISLARRRAKKAVLKLEIVVICLGLGIGKLGLSPASAPRQFPHSRCL